MELPPPARPLVIACDVSRIAHPDETALDTLARLQLAARRIGATLHLHNVCPVLADLIDCAGLRDVLVVAPKKAVAESSGVEVDREVEHRKQVRVDEEVLGHDDTA